MIHSKTSRGEILYSQPRQASNEYNGITNSNRSKSLSGMRKLCILPKRLYILQYTFLLYLLLLIPEILLSQMYIMNQDFAVTSGTIPPTGWENITLQGDPAIDLWRFDNPGNQTVNFPVTAPFAVFDAGTYSNNGQTEEAALETRSFDASASNFILLFFDHSFLPGAGAQAKLSAFNGEVWVDVRQWTSETANPTSEIIDISAYVGGITNARLRFTWQGNGVGYWALDNLRILAPLPLDGGLTRLDSPEIPFNTGIHQVKVTLANFGYQNLTSTTINWRVNGEPMPAYNWTGNLSFAEKAQEIILGSHNFQGPTLLEIWQSMPNGQQDLNPDNDSIITTVRPSLCGEYTIGGISPDFATISEAVSVLNLSGISCPVVFKIRDGIYEDQLLIRSIDGSSAENTITFESETGDSTAVSIAYKQWEQANVRLVSTDHIIFRGINFQGFYGLMIEDFSHNIHIENCYFTGWHVSIFLRSGSNDITIQNNHFQGGEYATLLQNTDGTILTYPFNVIIRDNSFVDVNHAMYIDGSIDVYFENNLVQTLYRGVAGYRGRNIIIRSNFIKQSNSSGYGIYLYDSDTIMVYNNYIRTQGNMNSYGIFMDNASNSKVYFNSINTLNDNLGGESAGLRLSRGNNNQFRNNIFSIKKAGYPAYITVDAQGYSFDFNNYYHPEGLIGQVSGTNYYDLSAWGQAISGDANSFAVLPFFDEGNDFSMNQILLNDAGTPLPEVIDDIDGTVRHPVTPDIGAKEYNPCQPDAGINSIVAPTNPVEPGSHNIVVQLQNQGSGNLNSATINWQVNGQLQTPYLWSGNLSYKENSEVVIGSYDFVGGLNRLVVWVVQPNGASDCNANNDTIETTLASKLCGDYTIGGISPDFATISEAVSVLNLAGISCPVVFKVRDGLYEDQLLIRSIDGSSAENTITFESESGDSSLTTLLCSLPAEYGSALNLNGASNMIFKNFGIIRLAPAYYSPIAIQLSNQSSNISFIDCYLAGAQCTVIYVDNGSTDILFQSNYIVGLGGAFNWSYHNIVIQTNGKVRILDNIVKNASSSGIYYSGASTNLKIVGNEFISNFETGIILNHEASSDLLVSQNTISSSRQGILAQGGGNISLIGNRIYNATLKGIEIISSNKTVINNFIQVEGINPVSGLIINGASNSTIGFNNIVVTGTNIMSRALEVISGSGLIFKNNNFSNQGRGYCTFISSLPASSTWDFNNYFSQLNKIGYLNGISFNTLNTWSLALGGESNGKNANPFFTSLINLTPNQVLLNNTAFPLAGIIYDIDSTFRNPVYPDISAKEFSVCAVDAGINLISTPTTPITEGQQNVSVVLQNQGSATLSSVIIHWSVNNITQPSYLWGGTLASGQNSEVIIGTYNFLAITSYQIKAWTSNPNNQSDCNNYNDTINSATLYTTLCGNYTIGGTEPDFNSFSEAVNFLNNAGISCPVIFKVRNGTYEEQIEINTIQGSSEINIITFESESGDSSLTTLICSLPAEYGSAVNLNGASNMIFKNLGIIRLAPAYNSPIAIQLSNQSSNISFIDCYLAGAQCTVIYVDNGSTDILFQSNYIVGLGGANHWSYHNIVIQTNGKVRILDNIIKNASSSGIYYSGASTNLKIVGNEFISNFETGIILNHEASSDLLVSQNTISSSRQGILAQGGGNISLIGNRIYNAAEKGICLFHSDSIIVFNNYILTQGNLNSYGIFMDNCSNSKVYFNSINTLNDNLGGESAGLRLSGGNNNQFRNNIFSIKNAGYPAYITVEAQGYSFDFNNYYHPEGLIGKVSGMNYFDLSAWGQAISGDANSKSVPPLFASDDNPLPYQRDLNGAGIPIPDILLDINGLIRNDAAPDIGCVEFFVDFGVTDLINPTMQCFQTAIENVTVLLRQFGDIPFIDLQLAYQVNNGPIVYDLIPGTIYNDLEFTFDATVNLSADGEYFFKVWLINTRDDNMNNDTLKVTRYFNPPPVLSFTTNAVCTGTFFNGIAIVAPPYTIASYEWDFGDGTTSNLQKPVHAYIEAGSYEVSFKAYANSGCYAVMTQTVLVESGFVPLSMNLDVFNQACFIDDNSSITVQINGGKPPFRIYLNDVLQNSVLLQNLGSGNYEVKVLDALDCMVSEQVTITAASAMMPVITATADSGFVPLSISFSFTAAQFDSWMWFANGETSTEASPTFVFEQYGDHEVVLEVYSGEPNNCTERAVYKITAEMVVAIEPGLILTPNGDGRDDVFEVSTKGIRELEVEIFDRRGLNVYNFNKLDGFWDGNYRSGAAAPDGVYSYVLQAIDFNDKDHLLSGVFPLIRETIAISPNPAKEKISVDVKGRVNLPYSWKIYDHLGHLVVSGENVYDPGNYEISLTGLNNGLYLIVLWDNQNIVSAKLIINN